MSGIVAVPSGSGVMVVPAAYGTQGGAGTPGAAGQNVDSIGLLTAATGMDTHGADLVRTSGNESVGIGVASYFKDSSVDLAAHPKAGFANNTGQKYRITREEAFNPLTQYEATDSDFQAAMERSLAYLESDASGGGFYPGGQEMFIPASHAGPYVMHDALIVRHRFFMHGVGGQTGPGSTGPTTFSWPDGVNSIIVQGADSVGPDNVTGTIHNGAHNFRMEGLMLVGPASGTVNDFPAIVCRQPVTFRDIQGRGLAGGLIRMWTGTLGGHNYAGDCSNSLLEKVKGEGCKYTLSIRGTNSNVIKTSKCEGYQNLQFAMEDFNAAGSNYHENWHNTFNGVPAPAAGPFTQCHKSGNIFTPNLACIDLYNPAATSALLAANAPPLTATSNDYWVYKFPGVAGPGQPDHASGGPWTYGGDALCFTPFPTEFNAFYSEGGGGMNQSFYNHTVWRGGTLDRTNVYGGTIISSGNEAYEFTRLASMLLRLRAEGAWGLEFRDFEDFLWMSLTGNAGGPTLLAVPSQVIAQVISGGVPIDVFAYNYFGIDIKTGKKLSFNGVDTLTGQMAALADLTAAPTQSDFNTLLARLRSVSLMHA